MYAFEREHGLADYGAALWWTAMLVTTMGSEYWPKSPEGRVLCLFLAIYAFAVFGYVTASLASFFVDRDAKTTKDDASGSYVALQQQIQSLQVELEQVVRELSRRGN